MAESHIEGSDGETSFKTKASPEKGTIIERLSRLQTELSFKINTALDKARYQVTEAEAEIANKRQTMPDRTKRRLTNTEVKLAQKYEASPRYAEGTPAAEAAVIRLEKQFSLNNEKQVPLHNGYASPRTHEELDFADEVVAHVKDWDERQLADKGDDNGVSSLMNLDTFRRRQDVLWEMLNEDANVDVAFVIDCTRSMDRYIQETKNDIHGIVNDIIKRFENRVRVAFVGYRDHSNGLSRIEYLGFTEGIAQFKDFVSKIRATGGGDPPEDVFGGLEAAINLEWASRNKIIFHIGDAPQHGGRYHDYSQTLDDHYHIEPRGLHVEELLDSIKRKHIKYYFGKINNSTDKMIHEFRRVAGKEVVEVTDIKDPRLLASAVVKSITKSIDFTLSRSIFGLKSIRDFEYHCYWTTSSEKGGKMWQKTLKSFSVIDTEPNYASMKLERNVKWLECEMTPLVTADTIRNHVGTIHHRWRTATIKRAQHPFSEGEQRISYHGSKISSLANQNIVLKEFKYDGRGMDRREDYIEIMETQVIAAYMAHQFNKVTPKGSKEIQFLHVSVVQIPQDDGTPKYYNVEVLLPDYRENFTKWNNNAGYVSELNYSATLDAFSHWTYDISDGFFVIVDLQGVLEDDRYVLTDPSINCVEPRFGRTNLGDIGIRMFFMSHSCGDVCQAMRLKKNKYMRSSTSLRHSNAYTRVAEWM